AQVGRRCPRPAAERGFPMSEWNFMDYQSKDNLLRAVREEADAMLALAGEPGVWEAPTGAGHWQVRDIIGHLVDTTEGYFASFDAARGNGPAPKLENSPRWCRRGGR